MTHRTLLASALAAALTLMSGAATAAAPIAFPTLTTTLKLSSDAGSCLDVEASIHKSGAKVLRWSCTDKPNQAWRISFANYPAFVVISASHSGKCLDLNASNTAPGTPITQWDCHGGENQRWVTRKHGSAFTLHARLDPSKCLDVGAADGATASLQPCNTAKPGQVFALGTPNYLELVAPSKPDAPAGPVDRMKIVFVGDTGVGKTEFIIAAATGAYPGEYIPQNMGPLEVTLTVDGVPATVTLVDTPGAADYDRLRPLAYPGTDLFVIVHSVVEPRSLESAVTRWAPELKRHTRFPWIDLLATKSEQFGQGPRAPSTAEQMSKYLERVNGIKWYEVSSLNQARVKSTLEDLVRDVRTARERARDQETKSLPR